MIVNALLQPDQILTVLVTVCSLLIMGQYAGVKKKMPGDQTVQD